MLIGWLPGGMSVDFADVMLIINAFADDTRLLVASGAPGSRGLFVYERGTPTATDRRSGQDPRASRFTGIKSAPSIRRVNDLERERAVTAA